MGPVTSVLLVWRVPDQPSEAVQLVAFVVVQLSVLVAPLTTFEGVAVRVTVAAGADPDCASASLARSSPPQPASRAANNSAAAVRIEFQQDRCIGFTSPARDF
jgi:hypothetical protein